MHRLYTLLSSTPLALALLYYVAGPFATALLSPVSLPPRPVRLNLIAGKYLGVPYVWGGQMLERPENTRSDVQNGRRALAKGTGVDCSGFLYALARRQGLAGFPRTASEQFVGLPGPLLAMDALEKGDLLFFRSTPTSTKVSHVGLFMGTDASGQALFIHASKSQGRVVLSPITPYFRATFAGGRRIPPAWQPRYQTRDRFQ